MLSSLIDDWPIDCDIGEHVEKNGCASAKSQCHEDVHVQWRMQMDRHAYECKMPVSASTLSSPNNGNHVTNFTTNTQHIMEIVLACVVQCMCKFSFRNLSCGVTDSRNVIECCVLE